jgi:hypothetical protein
MSRRMQWLFLSGRYASALALGSCASGALGAADVAWWRNALGCALLAWAMLLVIKRIEFLGPSDMGTK